MTSFFQRPIFFFLFLAALTVSALAQGTLLSKKDQEMVSDVRSRLLDTYVDQGASFRTHTARIVPRDYPSAPDLERKAWQLAQSKGAHWVGTLEPASSSSRAFLGLGRKKKSVARKQVYFFSIIHPQDQLGREMRLAPDRVAATVWSHDPEAQSTRLVFVDEIHHDPRVRFSFEQVENILRSH